MILAYKELATDQHPLCGLLVREINICIYMYEVLLFFHLVTKPSEDTAKSPAPKSLALDFFLDNIFLYS